MIPAPEPDLPAQRDAAARVALALALGDHAGATLVLGEPPPHVLAALAASATGISIVASTRRVRELRRGTAGLSPVWIVAVPVDGAGLPVVDEAHANLVVCDLDGRQPVDRLERALQATADGGRVFVDLPRPFAAERRVERLVDVACGGTAARPAWAAADRFTLSGRRRAPFSADLDHAPAGALPVTVIVVTRNAPARLESLLVDLLLRQNLPPRELIVLDLARGAEATVPPALFGITPGGLTRVALVPKPDASRGAAINDALGGVATPFVAILHDGDRLAANHLAALGMALEANADAVAAVGDYALVHGDAEPEELHAAADLAGPQALAQLVDAPVWPLGAALLRVDALRRVSGADPAFDRLLVRELWCRLLAGAPSAAVAHVPLPLAAITARHALDRDVTTEEASHFAESLATHVGGERLGADTPGGRGASPAAAGWARLARLHLAGGQAAEAAEAARAGLAVHGGDAACALLLGTALLEQGDAAGARALFASARQAAPHDPRWCIAGARVASTGGDMREARSLLERALELDPSAAVAHLDRLAVLVRDHAGATGALATFVRHVPVADAAYVDLPPAVAPRRALHLGAIE